MQFTGRRVANMGGALFTVTGVSRTYDLVDEAADDDLTHVFVTLEPMEAKT